MVVMKCKQKPTMKVKLEGKSLNQHQNSIPCKKQIYVNKTKKQKQIQPKLMQDTMLKNYLTLGLSN